MTAESKVSSADAVEGRSVVFSAWKAGRDVWNLPEIWLWLMGLCGTEQIQCVSSLFLREKWMDAPQISRCSSPKGCRDELRVFLQTPEGAVQPEIQSLALVVVQWGMEELLGWRMERGGCWFAWGQPWDASWTKQFHFIFVGQILKIPVWRSQGHRF